MIAARTHPVAAVRIGFGQACLDGPVECRNRSAGRTVGAGPELGLVVEEDTD